MRHGRGTCTILAAAKEKDVSVVKLPGRWVEMVTYGEKEETEWVGDVSR